MPDLQTAKNKALEIIEYLNPCFHHIEIAGSIRRGKPEVKDIELVAIPKMANDLLGQSRPVPVVIDGKLGEIVKNGDRYKQITLVKGYNLDLFIVLPPAQFGVIFAIRTGPDSFSKRLVTPKAKGGLLPSYARVHDGGVYIDDELMLMGNEQYFFEFLGIDWIEPGERK